MIYSVPQSQPIGTKRDELAYWLLLGRIPGIGPVTFARLLEHFSKPQRIFSATRAELDEQGIRGKLQDALLDPDWGRIKPDLAWLEIPGNCVITLHDPGYPSRLRAIHDPPPLLFVRGKPELLNMPQLAMVGSRNPNRSGENTAFSFAQYLSRVGLVITSGMAYGIDAHSHRGALAGSGLTIAVTGTGLDKIYPAQHKELANKIAETGALVSEFPPGTPPASQNFPRRNRIISGLSLGTLVVEATLRSGSLITARQAGEQGREVFAIPGSIHNPMAKGCHALLKEGAKLVESADDILEELRDFSTEKAFSSEIENNSGEEKLNSEYHDLLNVMGIDEPTSVDILVERSGLTVEAISSMLLILELKGLIASHSGGCYARLG